MTRQDRINKVHLEKRWQDTIDALAELSDLHVWPGDKDIAQVEGELLEELDAIEYELGQDLWKRGLL